VTWLDELTRRTVVVHTTDGMSMRGVLMPGYDDQCVLIHARLLQDDGVTSLMDGEVWIPREKVHFLQNLPADGAA
jgi:small nuclear ribonucleoprotein (snRNP)-like protein